MACVMKIKSFLMGRRCIYMINTKTAGVGARAVAAIVSIYFLRNNPASPPDALCTPYIMGLGLGKNILMYIEGVNDASNTHIANILHLAIQLNLHSFMMR